MKKRRDALVIEKGLRRIPKRKRPAAASACKRPCGPEIDEGDFVDEGDGDNKTGEGIESEADGGEDLDGAEAVGPGEASDVSSGFGDIEGGLGESMLAGLRLL